MQYSLNRKFRFWILIAGSLLLAIAGWRTSAQAEKLQIGWWSGVGVSDMTRIDKQIAAGQTFQAAYEGSDSDLAAYLTKLQQANVKTFLRLDNKAAKAGDTVAL